MCVFFSKIYFIVPFSMSFLKPCCIPVSRLVIFHVTGTACAPALQVFKNYLLNETIWEPGLLVLAYPTVTCIESGLNKAESHMVVNLTKNQE